MDCIFCAIAAGGIASETVYEDADIKAFKDASPSAPVHILVIPKAHIESIAHLKANHSDIIVQLIYRAKQIAADKGLRGYKLVFNVGREGGQVIDHLHLHLLGGWGNKENPDKFRV
ncbi:HIT domain-containing protein [Patescibacteria group bacterium]|nr:HIT domain-containing protein [Patescibacteria group bacterium]